MLSVVEQHQPDDSEPVPFMQMLFPTHAYKRPCATTCTAAVPRAPARRLVVSVNAKGKGGGGGGKSGGGGGKGGGGKFGSKGAQTSFCLRFLSVFGNG